MTFSKSAIKIGKGRIISAAEQAGGTGFILKSGGAALYLEVGNNAKAAKKGVFASYLDDCALIKGGLIERKNAAAVYSPINYNPNGQDGGYSKNYGGKNYGAKQ